MGDRLRGRSFIMSTEKARKLRPILEWLKKEAPHKRDREDARTILFSLRGIGDLEQLILGRRESELLGSILTEFPEVSIPDPKPRQLKLFTDKIFEPPTIIEEPFWIKKGIPRPKLREEQPKPVLKRKLTKSEQDEREKMGLSRLAWEIQEEKKE